MESSGRRGLGRGSVDVCLNRRMLPNDGCNKTEISVGEAGRGTV